MYMYLKWGLIMFPQVICTYYCIVCQVSQVSILRESSFNMTRGGGVG